MSVKKFSRFKDGLGLQKCRKYLVLLNVLRAKRLLLKAHQRRLKRRAWVVRRLSHALMKSSTVQIFKSPRWIAFYVSLGMMLAGHVGILLFDRPFTPPPGPKGEIFGFYDVLCIGSALLRLAGLTVCVISCLWILITAVISLFRRKT